MEAPRGNQNCIFILQISERHRAQIQMRAYCRDAEQCQRRILSGPRRLIPDPYSVIALNPSFSAAIARSRRGSSRARRAGSRGRCPSRPSAPRSSPPTRPGRRDCRRAGRSCRTGCRTAAPDMTEPAPPGASPAPPAACLPHRPRLPPPPLPAVRAFSFSYADSRSTVCS